MAFLDKVELAFTCPLRWEKLARGDTERFCGKCEKHVTNLSAMTREDAKSFLKTTPGPICVRVEVDNAGRSVHRPSLSIPAMSLSLLAGGPIPSCNEAPVMMGAPPPLMGEVAVQVDPIPVQHVGIPEVQAPTPTTPPVELLGRRPAPPPVPEKMGKMAMPTREMMGDYAGPVDVRD